MQKMAREWTTSSHIAFGERPSGAAVTGHVPPPKNRSLAWAVIAFLNCTHMLSATRDAFAISVNVRFFAGRNGIVDPSTTNILAMS